MLPEVAPNKIRMSEMVSRAQNGCRTTQTDILVLTEDFKNLLILRLSRQYRMTNHDIEDAQQEGVFWILEAIRHYEPGKRRGDASASFFTFTEHVICFRLKDFLRRRQRATCISEFRVADQCGKRKLKGVELLAPVSEEPSHVAESHELTDDLNWALSQLGEDSRVLWHLLSLGIRLAAIGEHLGISYEAVRRRKRRLFVELKSNLTKRCDKVTSLK